MLCFKPVLKENYNCFNGICVKPSKSFYFHSLCSCFCIEQTLNSSDCVNLQLKLGRDEVNDGVLDSVDCSDLLHFEVHLISKIKIYIELGKRFFLQAICILQAFCCTCKSPRCWPELVYWVEVESWWLNASLEWWTWLLLLLLLLLTIDSVIFSLLSLLLTRYINN